MGSSIHSRGFRETARYQGWCAVCGTTDGIWDAHHVVPKQELKRRRLPLYDQRGALRLCRICHEHHEQAFDRVPITALRDENIEYAFEILGAYAFDYLDRYYAGEPDERMIEYAAAQAAAPTS